MNTEERCDLTELIVTQCAHCRPPRRPRFLEPLLNDLGDNDIVATFTARYGGRCADCDKQYNAGAYISRTTDDLYICSDCF